MDEREERLWKLIEKEAAFVSSGAAFNSDVFYLLACILAYYQFRGTSPQQMISGRIPELIESILEREVEKAEP